MHTFEMVILGLQDFLSAIYAPELTWSWFINLVGLVFTVYVIASVTRGLILIIKEDFFTKVTK
jgi:hypothetical protein